MASETTSGFDRLLTTDIVKTFDQIAKTAMQASSEFCDPDSTLTMIERIQKAHSAVTLIIDDAMRGLNTAMVTGLGYAISASTDAETGGQPSGK